ncbi:hypothetical protein LEGA110927_03585 [Leuconostoc gasicomitatum]|uniref:hypothetical protein n=1 Tax=Leuconostoc gasicomitatum TaxID=115778 RepID=UPI000BCFA1DA|nr:hypothetical protein [Leuconostoc gasicomitatum]MBZ5943894.1 hypothetical protein [Leuconostoc gasicomitatum]MBZ5949286.1 hypothetical protein [Leuconostoc gasicomitatum]MBZ5951227.1 hypothetical protein [Leuconostoc gasicomitatum]MBZ5967299.1 hypothetical protein [Leuconostoc gasicomitatum]MBZ5971331.1 hypothetical protein [Leuconostoc gasicomitatum]
MTLFKKQHDLLSYLETIHLDDSVEQAMVERAISQLKKKTYEHKVIVALAAEFRKLALEQQISKAGLALYMKLQKPNIEDDVGLTVGLWF